VLNEISISNLISSI